ncbi:uncharacterized protein JN550_007245 [Neoarthrinium moseri]|uniref:uncharacterized protein n=1 Tax=Neoarthrinium moseri TaxID=1658444 RepID=UPI001FDC5B59|nr:uncharacterized protein JN550_007245 [Neoarthrinium moseri]KAI1867193.1 hypothetical protein JN550_007245 [Neoarthrinium moseri]
MYFGAIWTQIFPPRNGAPLTERNLPSQAGRVFIVTGRSSGLGYELSRIFYGLGGKVYILTRSKGRAEEAMAKIRAHNSNTEYSTGSLMFLHLDLLDFSTVKAAAQQFLEL